MMTLITTPYLREIAVINRESVLLFKLQMRKAVLIRAHSHRDKVWPTESLYFIIFFTMTIVLMFNWDNPRYSLKPSAFIPHSFAV